MKRVILSIVFILFACVCIAQDYDFDVNRLANKLDLTQEQTEYLWVITSTFNRDIANAYEAKGHKKVIKMADAIKKNLKQTSKVLNDEQQKTYAKLLLETIKNNHINKIIYELESGRYNFSREVH